MKESTTKSMKKFGVSAVALSTALLVGCGSAASSSASSAASVTADSASSASEAQADSTAASGKRVLTYAQHNSKDSTNGQTTQVFADYINEHSDTMEVDVYYNGELGGIQEAVEGVAMGTIDMTASSFASLSSLYADMEVFSMPYLVKSGEDNLKLMDLENNETLKEIIGGFEQASGLKVFGVQASYEARQLTANFEVHSPDDLKGHKIRSITNDVYTMAVEGLGGTPVPIDWTETPTALSTGTVEGQENPYSTLVSCQMWDVQKYVMETNHIFDSSVSVVSQDLWDELTTDEQQVLVDANAAMQEYSYKTQKENQDAYRQECIDNGMTVVTEAEGLDIDAFKSNTDTLKSARYAKYQAYFDALDAYLGY